MANAFIHLNLRNKNTFFSMFFLSLLLTQDWNQPCEQRGQNLTALSPKASFVCHSIPKHCRSLTMCITLWSHTIKGYTHLRMVPFQQDTTVSQNMHHLKVVPQTVTSVYSSVLHSPQISIHRGSQTQAVLHITKKKRKIWQCSGPL